MLNPMLSPYRRLFQTPGGFRFSAAAFIGRMSISMDSLALIFIVVHASHSYTLAGALAAVAATVMALVLPLWSRVSDRIGQRKTYGSFKGIIQIRMEESEIIFHDRTAYRERRGSGEYSEASL